MKKTNWLPALLLSSAFAITTTYAFAQMGPGPEHGKKKGMAMPMHKMDCPMMQDGDRVEATATVVNNKDGAVLTLRAKQPADVARVQQMAAMMAKHIEEGCPMQPGPKAPEAAR